MRADLPGVLIALIVAGVVGFVGIQVMSTVVDTTSISQGQPFYNSSQALQTGFDDAFGLVAVAFLVIVLAVIVTYLYGLRGR